MAVKGGNDEWKFYKDKKDEHRWTRTATNGEIVGSAHEGYKNKADAVANAKRAGYKG